MQQTAFRSAERAQRSVLAGVEKRCLVWLAERLPRWVTSDQLTLFGLLSMLAAGLSYWIARYNPVGLL